VARPAPGHSVLALGNDQSGKASTEMGWQFNARRLGVDAAGKAARTPPYIAACSFSSNPERVEGPVI
jgi:hypothetical protein